MSLFELMKNFERSGSVRWIGVRPGRGMPVQAVEEVLVDLQDGLQGDRFRGKPGSVRQVTLIQAEHLEVVAKLIGRESIDPALLRRNLVVEGINLLALRSQEFRIGSAVLMGSGNCAPCSQMEAALGRGGYNAMRGHGGITATVIEPGVIRLNDPVSWLRRREKVIEYDD
jgi:MOSC domain-containing protein YiiM